MVCTSGSGEITRDGSLRICTDYQKLNAVTKMDPYPVPNIQETLDQLGRDKYFSALDLASGYWLVEMDPDAREKNSIHCPWRVPV